MTQSATTTPRDGRFDVLRGLCLLNMVLMHLIGAGLVLPWVMQEAVSSWLRFAAGGFVLISGLCVGAIHARRAVDPQKRWRTYRSLWKRAGYVLLVHYAATMLVLLDYAFHGLPPIDARETLWNVLLLREGYDLLLFYVVMLAASPLAIASIRRCGSVLTLVGSAVLFAWHHDSPALQLYAIEHDFVLVRWQLIFVIGLVLGWHVRSYDAMARSGQRLLLVASTAISLAIGLLSSLQWHGQIVSPWWLSVSKLPLSPLEVVRYVSLTLCLAIGVDRAWPWLSQSRVRAVLSVIGVNSLLLWIVHSSIVSRLTQWHWLLAIAAAFAAMWIVAKLATLAAQAWQRLPLPALGRVTPVVVVLISATYLLRTEPAAMESIGFEVSQAEDDASPLIDDLPDFSDYDAPRLPPIEADPLDNLV